MQMSRSSASYSATTTSSSRCCSDSAFSDSCSHSDGDWTADDSESHADNACDDGAALTPREELALFEDLIDEMNLSTNDIFDDGLNNNSDDNSESPTCTTGKAASVICLPHGATVHTLHPTESTCHAARVSAHFLDTPSTIALS